MPYIRRNFPIPLRVTLRGTKGEKGIRGTDASWSRTTFSTPRGRHSRQSFARLRPAHLSAALRGPYSAHPCLALRTSTGRSWVPCDTTAVASTASAMQSLRVLRGHSLRLIPCGGDDKAFGYRLSPIHATSCAMMWRKADTPPRASARLVPSSLHISIGAISSHRI